MTHTHPTHPTQPHPTHTHTHTHHILVCFLCSFVFFFLHKVTLSISPDRYKSFCMRFISLGHGGSFFVAVIMVMVTNVENKYITI